MGDSDREEENWTGLDWTGKRETSFITSLTLCIVVVVVIIIIIIIIIMVLLVG